MNLKINNELRCSMNLASTAKKPDNYVKEERRRTGRYIAILVGISLFLLAIYHAWVRRIPIVASLVVPALIMFVYVGWVLYTASRDKHKLLDAEAALAAAQEAEMDAMNDAQNNLEISIVSSKDSSRMTSPDHKEWDEQPSVIRQDIYKEDKITFIKPIILINDVPIEKPEDLDQKWNRIVETLPMNERLKAVQNKRKFKRKFCRRRRYAAFKRSYSIG